MVLIEIFLGIIAGSMFTAGIFGIFFLYSAKKTLTKANDFIDEGKDQLYYISQRSINLLDDTDDLILDIKRKTDSVDFLFAPLEKYNKNHNEPKIKDYIYQIEELLSIGIILFDKVKNRK
jgi:uncharacterized protein YoxC